MARGLNHKERMFLEAFLGPCNGNGTKAAQVAGYGTTRGTSANLAHRLLRKAHIQKAIAAFVKKRDETLIATVEERDAVRTELLRKSKNEAIKLRAGDALDRAQARGKAQAGATAGSLAEALAKSRTISPEQAKAILGE